MSLGEGNNSLTKLYNNLCMLIWADFIDPSRDCAGTTQNRANSRYTLRSYFPKT